VFLLNNCDSVIDGIVRDRYFLSFLPLGMPAERAMYYFANVFSLFFFNFSVFDL